MKLACRFSLSILLTLLAGCSSNAVMEEVLTNPNYDISSFRTYTWA